jgi:Na+/proline symporter
MVGWGIAWCALFVVSVSVFWSSLAGIKTVIWTDFLLFVFFTLGAVFMLVFIGMKLDQTVYEGLHYLDQQARLVLFDFSVDPEVRYTIWAGVLGGISLNIAQATTQGTWQRVKACPSAGDAQKAYNWAAVCYLVHLIILGVGLALVLFYAENPLAKDFEIILQESPDRIFPFFLISEMPVGLSGLFIAAIFAAAISTLDSSLTETADLTVRHIYERFVNPGASETQFVSVARISLVFWGAIFLGVSILFSRYSAEGLLNLTFQLPNYVYGALLGTIVLARYGIGRFSSFIVGFLVSCLVVLLLSQFDIAFFYWCPISGLAMCLVVWSMERTQIEWSGVVRQEAA